MYIKPIAKSGVYFTKNLTETNRKNGEWLLGYYWRDSKISKPPYYPITNFQGMLNFLTENYPTYIESLGDLMNSVTSDKLIQSMKDAAKKNYLDYPRPSYLANSIIANTGVSIAAVTGDALKEAGLEIVGYAALFSKAVIFTAIAAAVFFVWKETGGGLPKLKLKALKVFNK